MQASQFVELFSMLFLSKLFVLFDVYFAEVSYFITEYLLWEVLKTWVHIYIIAILYVMHNYPPNNISDNRLQLSSAERLLRLLLMFCWHVPLL